MPEKKNTSAEYIKTIALLYNSAKGHGHIANEMIKQFLLFVKTKYRIRIDLQNTDNHVARISQLSEIDAATIRNIFKLHMKLDVTADDSKNNLIQLNQHLEYFYKNCR